MLQKGVVAANFIDINKNNSFSFMSSVMTCGRKKPKQTKIMMRPRRE
jgi:hypothetical protein